MSEFQEKRSDEEFQEVHMSHSTDEAEVTSLASESVQAVNVSKIDEKSDQLEEDVEEETDGSVIPMKQV